MIDMTDCFGQSVFFGVQNMPLPSYSSDFVSISLGVSIPIHIYIYIYRSHLILQQGTYAQECWMCNGNIRFSWELVGWQVERSIPGQYQI